jgi:pyruvate formate lyase activating enzyme
MAKVNRRHFLRTSAACLAGAAAPPLCTVTRAAAGTSGGDIQGSVFRKDAPRTPGKWSKEAYLYRKLEENTLVCGICPNQCELNPGDRGICRSKVNIDGVLYSLAYGNPCAVNVDPIEKKPLYHFHPRITAFSIAAAGCNFRCLNCQNYEISQAKPHEVRNVELFPPEVIREAQRAGAAAVAYTYSEPITFFEYMMETARLARGEGLANLLISNGYINCGPLLDLCKVLDAANINLKAYDDGVYRRLNGGRLAPVLATFKTLHEQGVHFEMTNLVVPGYVDDEEAVGRMCGWILEALGQDHPLHFLRFFPRYKLDRLPPTPVSTLERFRELALKAGIRYVYIGNVPGHEGNHTYCHNCNKLLIRRDGYIIPVYELEGERCRHCGTRIPGVWG